MKKMMVVVAVPLVMMMMMPALRMTAEGHGMLLDPPQRSSLWRDDRFLDAPVNNQDSGLFCGGFYVQYFRNHGQCGICGDAFSDPHPRPNEAGGKYGRGITARTYNQADVIMVTVRITANHLGHFAFKLCPNDDVNREVTQECLDKHVLKVFRVSSAGEVTISDKYPVRGHLYGDTQIRLQLPSDVACSQCVLQWTYKTGHSWGCDLDGTCGIGHGKQETFVNCADIAIAASSEPTKVTVSDVNRARSTIGQSAMIQSNDKPTTSTSEASKENTQSDVSKMRLTAGQLAASQKDDKTTTVMTEVKENDATAISSETDASNTRSTVSDPAPPRTDATTMTTLAAATGARGVCRSAGAYAGKARMDAWCRVQCAVGYCPATHCTCS